MHAAASISAPVQAVQDLDCLDRVKFRYALPHPLTDAFLDAFPAAQARKMPFSRLVPNGRDLYVVEREGVFHAEGIHGGDTLIVAFEGNPLDWPLEAISAFNRCLERLAYGPFHMTTGESADCANCATRFAKKCRGLTH